MKNGHLLGLHVTSTTRRNPARRAITIAVLILGALILGYTIGRG